MTRNYRRVQLQWWRRLGLHKKGGLIPVELLRSRIHTERAKPNAHWYLAQNGKTEQVISGRQERRRVGERGNDVFESVCVRNAKTATLL